MNNKLPELNEVFTITKGKRTARWKIINHPFFPDSYAIVNDYNCVWGRMNSKNQKEDANHVVGGGITIEQAYKAAYDMT